MTAMTAYRNELIAMTAYRNKLIAMNFVVNISQKYRNS